jgi:AcrR family transcriptional regulator
LLASEDQPAPPVQQRSRDKRDQLLAAGLGLFGEKGYEAASVDEIAARAGVAVGGFYQHFRGKRQLLLVLMDELLERLSRLDLRPAIGAPGTAGAVRQPRRAGGSKACEGDRNTGASVQAALGALLQRAFAADLAYTGAYRAWREAVLIDGGLARDQEQIERWTRARVEAVLALLLRLPGARTDVDLPVLARLMDRLFWDLLGQALRLSADERIRILAAITHLLYHALFADA